MSKENVYDKWHFVFRPKCGITSIHCQRIIDYLHNKFPYASYILSCEDAKSSPQSQHFDFAIAFTTPKRKSNFLGHQGRGLIKAIFHDQLKSTYHRGIFGRPVKDLNEWEHVIGYCQKEHRTIAIHRMHPHWWTPPDVIENRDQNTYLRDCLEDYQRNELKLLKRKQHIGRIVLTKKDWEVYMMDWMDRHPAKFETPLDVALSMLNSGRYVFGFVSQKSRWRLFEHYFYGTEPNTAELYLMMTNQEDRACLS